MLTKKEIEAGWLNLTKLNIQILQLTSDGLKAVQVGAKVFNEAGNPLTEKAVQERILEMRKATGTLNVVHLVKQALKRGIIK